MTQTVYTSVVFGSVSGKSSATNFDFGPGVNREYAEQIKVMWPYRGGVVLGSEVE